MLADLADLLAQPVGEAGDGVGGETVYAPLRPAGARQLAVILGAREVVMVAQQMACRLRQARLQQDRQFDQARGAAVAVAERVYPRQMDMREDRLEYRERMAVCLRRREVRQRRAQAIQQIRRVAPAGAAVGAHRNVGRPHPARNDVVLRLQPAQDDAVHARDGLGGERNPVRAGQLACELAIGGGDVVDFPPQIFPGRRQLQRALDARAGLCLRQGVALDGGRCQRALREIQLVDGLGDLRMQRRGGDAFAHRRACAERQPVGVFEPARVEGEVDPPMRPLVLPARRRAPCHGPWIPYATVTQRIFP